MPWRAGAFALVGTLALALLPLVAPPYYATLMIPFFGYAIALLGFNLLFGYTGLLSFGHAMFLGAGAYGAAFFAGVLGISSFELVLLAVVLFTMLAAIPIGFLCVRNVGIFFGCSRSPSACCFILSCSSSITSPAGTAACACRA